MLRALAASLPFAAAPAGAATIVLDFEEEALGNHGASFVSAECGCVQLSELGGIPELRIVKESGDRVLSVGDQGGTLVLDFFVPVVAVEILFGGDTSDPLTEVFPARLTGYSGGQVTAEATLEANRNGAIDQTIAITSPVALEQAIFDFVQLGENQPIGPLVGRIALVTVPEPGTLALLAVAALLAAGGRRAPGARALCRAVACALLLAAAPAYADTIVLDFEEEPPGERGPSFRSIECGCVDLVDSSDGRALMILRSDAGQALLVAHEGGVLNLHFLVPVTSVALDFGGDQPSVEGQPIHAEPAELIGFARGERIATARLAANQDGLVNQTLSISSDRPMNGAVFFFYQLGEYNPLDPIVDNITFETVLEPNNERVAVCHKGRTLLVGGSALEAHLAHGDSEGVCPGP